MQLQRLILYAQWYHRDLVDWDVKRHNETDVVCTSYASRPSEEVVVTFRCCNYGCIADQRQGQPAAAACMQVQTKVFFHLIAFHLQSAATAGTVKKALSREAILQVVKMADWGLELVTRAESLLQAKLLCSSYCRPSEKPTAFLANTTVRSAAHSTCHVSACCAEVHKVCGLLNKFCY